MAKAKKTKSVTPLAGAVGRRKEAVARIWIRPGSGKISVNKKDVNAYFDTSFNIMTASMPITLLPVGKKYDFAANVKGGGLNAQAGAIKLGISRALLEVDETLRPTLRKLDLLTVDSRRKERKKYGQRGARRKFQFVKR